jgi:hypothetical protein
VFCQWEPLGTRPAEPGSDNDGEQLLFSDRRRSNLRPPTQPQVRERNLAIILLGITWRVMCSHGFSVCSHPLTLPWPYAHTFLAPITYQHYLPRGSVLLLWVGLRNRELGPSAPVESLSKTVVSPP